MQACKLLEALLRFTITVLAPICGEAPAPGQPNDPRNVCNLAILQVGQYTIVLSLLHESKPYEATQKVKLCDRVFVHHNGKTKKKQKKIRSKSKRHQVVGQN
jgi:hypothetical protein